MTTVRTPLVCICVPTYNAALTLTETLVSILGQTYQNLKVLVVDNASTDGTPELADVFAAKDPRLTVLRHSENVGAEGNFTRCLQLASGDYTAIYHSDDIYAPSMVQEEVEFLERNPEAGVVFTMAAGIDARGVEKRLYRIPRELRGREDGLFAFPEIFRTMLKHGNFLFCPSAMARTPVYRDYIRKWDAGGYRTSSDCDVWLRIAQRYRLGVIDKPLLKYRLSEASFSYTASRTKTGQHDMLRLFRVYVDGPAKRLIGDVERKDLCLLVLKDDVNRSFNSMIMGKDTDVRPLLRGLFSPALIFYSIKTPAHFKVFVYGFTILLISFLPLGVTAKKILFRLRY